MASNAVVDFHLISVIYGVTNWEGSAVRSESAANVGHMVGKESKGGNGVGLIATGCGFGI
jgi:hypothetical protein